MATALVRFCVIALAAASQPPVNVLVRIINQNVDTDHSYLTSTGPDAPLALGQYPNDPQAWWNITKVDGCTDDGYPCYNIMSYALRAGNFMVSCCTSDDIHLDTYANDDGSGNQRFTMIDYTGGPNGWIIKLNSKSRFYRKNFALLSSGHHGEYVDLSYLHSQDPNANEVKWQYWKIEVVSPPSPHPSIKVIPDCTIGDAFGYCTPQKTNRCSGGQCCPDGHTCPNDDKDTATGCLPKEYTCKRKSPKTADTETAKDGNDPRTMFP